MNISKKLLFYIGIFLLLDGILSYYFGNACLNECLNNNNFGNLVRIIRAVIGGLLMYRFK